MAKVEEYDAQGNIVVDEPEHKEVEETTSTEESAEQGKKHEEKLEDDPAEVKATDTETIRGMRDRFKELRAEKIRLQNELEEARKQGPQQQGELKEPTMEENGFDSKRYRDAMVEYTRKVVEQESKKTAAQKEQEEANAAWQASLNDYNSQKKQIANFGEAELAIDSTLSPVQKGIIVSAANNPAKMMFEIGNDDNLLHELSKMKNLTQFAAKIGELNARTKRTALTPKPESRITAPSAATALAGGTDKKLAALREEADATGDYTKVNAYKKMLAKGGK